jgi:ElaB/YqjD/DUF883 family membrane-anchored ribosome-binding protein
MSEANKMDPTDFQREMNNLKTELATLRGDMSSLVGTIKELTKQGAGNVKDKAREQVDHGLEQLENAYEGLRRQGSATCEKVHKTVEEHPMGSVMVALGAGVVLGHLLARGNRH